MENYFYSKSIVNLTLIKIKLKKNVDFLILGCLPFGNQFNKKMLIKKD